MVLDTVAGFIGRATGLVEDSTVVYECRRCGLSVEQDGEDRPTECPNCGPEAALVRYEFD